MAGWESGLRAASEYPNVLAKVSGLNTALGWADWGAEDLRASVEVAVDCFGTERLMCGSDWPVALLNGEFDRVWAMTAQALCAAAPGAREQLLGGNAGRVYRLGQAVGAR